MNWKKELKSVIETVKNPVPLTDFCHVQPDGESPPKINDFFNSPVFDAMLEGA